MELVIMYLVAIAAVGIVGFMLVKKMDIKISLFLSLIHISEPTRPISI